MKGLFFSKILIVSPFSFFDFIFFSSFQYTVVQLKCFCLLSKQATPLVSPFPFPQFLSLLLCSWGQFLSFSVRAVRTL